jgi:hypothetical protein
MVKMLLTLARCLLFEITCYRPQLETIYQIFQSNIETHNNIKFLLLKRRNYGQKNLIHVNRIRIRV